MKLPIVPLFLAVALLLTPCLPVLAADEPVDAARAVFEKHQKSVVWVSAVMKMRAGGALGGMFGRQEQKVEAVGTVIDESGLTVLSYTMLDPSAMFNAAMQNVNVGGGENKVEFKTELSGVKIRLADGTEVPAKLILRDDDLDLAFVMPTEAGKKLPFLKLGEGGAAGGASEVKPLDPLVVIWRLGQSLDRQPAVAISRVSAVVTKPRTFYLCTGVEAMGTPAFTADGKPLGIVVMRKQGMEAMGGGLMSLASSGGVSPIVIPAADVMEVAQQALAKKDEPVAEPKTAADEKEPAAGSDKTDTPKAKPGAGKAPPAAGKAR